MPAPHSPGTVSSRNRWAAEFALTLVISFALTAAFALPAAAQSREANLIPNPSFEELNNRGLPANFNTFVPAGTPEGSVAIVSDATRSRTGTRSVRLDSSGERVAVARAVRLTGGRAYRLTVWYQASEGIQPEHVAMRVMAYRATPHTQANKVPWRMAWVHEPYESVYQVAGENFMIYPDPVAHGAGDWTRLAVAFTLPEEIVGIDVHLFNQRGHGSIWFDDISLIELPPEETKSVHADSPILPSLATLRQGHPRIMATEADFERIKELISNDSLAAQWYAGLRLSADRILRESPSSYVLPDGKRLLATSRTVLDRVETLALMYRLGGDRRYLERVWKELEAAAAFPDWNPSHFLDTAEMTRAFAIAYDWLYDSWTEDERRFLRAAILEKGLRPALLYYRGQKPPDWQWSPTWTQNWNFVVNGGITIGALAIADEAPHIAEEILREGFKSVQLAIGRFGPDGAWDEGVSYWHYSIRYLIAYIISLETALGTDFGLAQTPGIGEAGFFPIYLTGPNHEVFNFGDAGTGVPRAPEMFWLAQKFNQPVFAQWHRRTGRLLGSWGSLTNNLLWYAAGLGDDASLAELPLDKYFRGVEVVSLRSSWEDPEAVFVAFKGGEANVNHGHLDLGGFVLDALGVRWAEETGADNYNLPGYNNRGSGQRWTYYRTRAEGQNTLVINPGRGPDQDVRAFARLLFQASKAEEAVGILDLSSAYAPHARVRRGVALFDNRRQVLIQDEVSAQRPSELWWFMHTKADIELSEDGRAATLRRGDKRLLVRLLSPGSARFHVMAARPLPTSPDPPGQNPNSGIRKLAVHLENVTDLRLVVQFTPLKGAEEAPVSPAILPLEEWEARFDDGLLWPPLPRMLLEIVSPKPGENVYGRVPLALSLDAPDEIAVEEVTVRFGEEEVYRSQNPPEGLLLDTRRLDDGVYTLAVQARLASGETASRAIPVRVANWWSLKDDFEPPHVSWLGTIDRSKTYAESPGWAYATDQPGAFFGDATRRVRTGETAEHLVWESPNLRAFQIWVYAPTEDLDEILLVEVSQDGASWREVPYRSFVKERSSSGRFWLEIAGDVSEADASWFRVTLQAGSVPAGEVQLGRVELTGLR